MKYTDVLGLNLKSDFIDDLFETYDVDVIYKYDRTHDGLEDEYSGEILDMGLEFLFNKDQKLTTLFMKKVHHTGHNPFGTPDPRLVQFESKEGAVEYAKENNINAVSQKAKKDPFFGKIPAWVKFNYGNYSIHYEFNENGINMVTLQRESA